MAESILWELTKLRRHMGGTKGVLFYVFGVLLLGILAPWYLGFDFVDVPVLLTYACLSLLLVPPVVAESVAGEGERALRPAEPSRRREWLLAKVGAGALYGWISTIFILALAIASLRLALGRFLPPPALLAAGLALLSLAVSLFAAAVAAAVAMGARGAKHAKRNLRQGLLLLLVILIYLSRLSGSRQRRLALPTTGAGFVEFAVVTSIGLAGVSLGLLRLALTRSEPEEIHLNI
jgi:hypothetical protein